MLPPSAREPQHPLPLDDMPSDRSTPSAPLSDRDASPARPTPRALAGLPLTGQSHRRAVTWGRIAPVSPRHTGEEFATPRPTVQLSSTLMDAAERHATRHTVAPTNLVGGFPDIPDFALSEMAERRRAATSMERSVGGRPLGAAPRGDSAHPHPSREFMAPAAAMTATARHAAPDPLPAHHIPTRAAAIRRAEQTRATRGLGRYVLVGLLAAFIAATQSVLARREAGRATLSELRELELATRRLGAQRAQIEQRWRTATSRPALTNAAEQLGLRVPTDSQIVLWPTVDGPLPPAPEGERLR